MLNFYGIVIIMTDTNHGIEISRFIDMTIIVYHWIFLNNRRGSGCVSCCGNIARESCVNEIANDEFVVRAIAVAVEHSAEIVFGGEI